eukprot:756808-Hanusia_phi.AAC.3
MSCMKPCPAGLFELSAFRWILTAAHCVLNAAETQIIPAADSQRVYFGCSDLHSTTYPCQQRTVKEIVANPCFDPCCDYHDIAMLKVDKGTSSSRDAI